MHYARWQDPKKTREGDEDSRSFVLAFRRSVLVPRIVGTLRIVFIVASSKKVVSTLESTAVCIMIQSVGDFEIKQESLILELQNLWDGLSSRDASSAIFSPTYWLTPLNFRSCFLRRGFMLNIWPIGKFRRQTFLARKIRTVLRALCNQNYISRLLVLLKLAFKFVNSLKITLRIIFNINIIIFVFHQKLIYYECRIYHTLIVNYIQNDDVSNRVRAKCFLECYE